MSWAFSVDSGRSRGIWDEFGTAFLGQIIMRAASLKRYFSLGLCALETSNTVSEDRWIV
jgi:hypothetical protein